jgi:methionine-rich copper-binding protein CopC
VVAGSGGETGAGRFKKQFGSFRMKFMRTVCALVLMGCSGWVCAHTHLVKSDPANGATVTTAPTKFVLTFAEPAKLTLLSLQKDAEPARKLGPLPTTATAEISLPAPQLKAGKYVLSWRALSDDGHVMPGKLSFTVAQ